MKKKGKDRTHPPKEPLIKDVVQKIEENENQTVEQVFGHAEMPNLGYLPGSSYKAPIIFGHIG